MSPKVTPVLLDTAPDVASLVRQMRMHAGLAQQQLAARPGLPLSALARLERAETVDLSLGRALQLLRVLGLRVQAMPAPPGPTLTGVLDDVRNGRNTGPNSR